MSNYDEERIEGAKTLGDAYRHHRRDPEAFVAGAQYALDSILREAERVRSAISPLCLDALATEVLRRAKAGEPQ